MEETQVLNTEQVPTDGNDPKVAAQRVKQLHDALVADEVMKDYVPNDFRRFVEVYKEPKNMNSLYDALSADDVFKDYIPNSKERMYDLYVLGKSSAEPAKEPLQSSVLPSPSNGGVEFGLNQTIKAEEPKPNVLAKPQPLSPEVKEELEVHISRYEPTYEGVTGEIKFNEFEKNLTEKQLKKYEDELNGYQAQSDSLTAIYENESLSLQERNKAIDEYNKVNKEAKLKLKEYEKLDINYKSLLDRDKQLRSDLVIVEKMRQKGLETEYDHIKNIKESVEKGFVDAGVGLGGMFTTLFIGDPEDPETIVESQTKANEGLVKLKKFGETLITQEVPKNYEKFFEGDFSAGKLAYITTNAVSSTIPTVAAGLLTGGTGSILTGAALSFEESKGILEEAGLTTQQAKWASLGLSIPIGLLEKFGADDIVRLFNSSGFKKQVASELAKKIAGKTLTKEAIFTEAKKTLGEVIKSKTSKLLKAGITEPITEMAQGQVLETAKQITQEFTGVDKDENMSTEDYLKEQLLQRGEEGVGGFLGGTSLGAAGTAYSSVFGKSEFTPSAYTKAMEYADPAKFEQFKKDLASEVQSGVLTEQQANEAILNVQAIQETNALIPKSVQDLDLRTDALNLIIEKNDLIKEIEGKDPDLIIAENTRLAEIKTSLNEIALGNKPKVEGATTQSTTEAAQKTNEVKVKEEEQASTEVEQPTQPKITFTEAISVPENDFVYNGEQGKLIQEGQTISFETKDRIYELGTVEELNAKGIDELGIEKLNAIDVVLNDDNSLVIEGEKFVNNFSNPDAAINYDSDGNVVSVNLETESGQKRTFRGQRAEEIAYQFKLKSLEQDGTDEQIDTAIQQAEQAVEAERVADETAPKRKGKSARQRRKEKKLKASQQQTKTTQNAIQEPSTTQEVPRTGEAGQNIPKGSQGVRPGEQGKETAQQGKEEVTTKTKQDEKQNETNGKVVLEGVREKGNENEGGQSSEQLRTEIESKEKQVADLRAKEQAELDAKIPNAEQYRVNGKVDRNLLTNDADREAFDKIDSAYDKQITPLLREIKGLETTKQETPKSKAEQIGEGLLDFLGVGSKGEAKNNGVNVSNKSALSDLEGKTTGNKRAIIEAAKKAIATLKSVFPNMDIYIHEDNDSYNEAMEEVAGVQNSVGNFAYESDSNNKPTGRGRIDINLSKANARTVAHEVSHAIMLKAFGDNPAVFKDFRNKISKILNESSNKALMDFANQYVDKQGNLLDVTYEEYLAELTGALAAQEGKLSPTTLQKIAALINDIVSKLTNGKLKPFEDIKDTKQVIEFFNNIANSIRAGKEIKNVSNRIGEQGNKKGFKSRSQIVDKANTVKDIDVKNIRTLSRPGKRVSKGLSVKTVNKKKVVSEAEDLSLDYVKENAPNIFIDNANIIAEYPIVEGVKKIKNVKTVEQAQEVYDIFVRQVANNLKYLIDNFNDDFREVSTLWYDGANILAQNFSEKYGVSEEQAAGIIAAMSPQKDWYQNVRLAEMVMMAFKENPIMSDDMVNKQALINTEGLKPSNKKVKDAQKKYDLSKTKINKGKLDSAKKDLEEKTRKGNKVVEYLKGFVGKNMDSVPDEFKCYFTRLWNEVNTTKDYDVLRPDSKVMGVAMNKDGVTKSKVAWGSYTEIGKAVSIYIDGSQENITKTLGEMHKIRNFYNNIIDPMSQDKDVTMDTHAIAAALLMPLSGNTKQVGQNFGTGTSNSSPLGIKGLYYAYAEAYNLAAEENNLLPRQVQSITWEAVRGLFTDVFKSKAENVNKINEIWSQYTKGRININEARNEISNYSGGIKDPTWAKPLQEGIGNNVESGNIGGRGDGNGRSAVGESTADRGKIKSKSQNAQAEDVVKDKNGKPLVVYHGTGTDFESFDSEKSSDATRFGKGISFTDGKGIAMRYSLERQGLEDNMENDEKAIIKPANLIMKKPFDERGAVDATTPEAIKLKEILVNKYGLNPKYVDNVLSGNTPSTKSAFQLISEAIFDPATDKKTFMFVGNTEKTRKLLEEVGYDSIIDRYEDSFEYFVFDAKNVISPTEAIKSKSQNAQNSQIQDYIEIQRKAGESDANIKKGLEYVADKLGLTPADIDNLMFGEKVAQQGEAAKEAVKPETPTAQTFADISQTGKAGRDARESARKKFGKDAVAKMEEISRNFDKLIKQLESDNKVRKECP
jgi:hypothetical protein